jgi:hypothetical protein
MRPVRIGHLSQRGLHEGSEGRATLLGTPKDMLSKTLEWARFQRGPLVGNMEGRSFLRAFEINRYIKRYVKMSYKWVSP